MLQRNSNDCFQINGNHMIKMAQKGKTVKFKNYTRKTKLLVYDHMSILIHKIMESKIQISLIRINYVHYII